MKDIKEELKIKLFNEDDEMLNIKCKQESEILEEVRNLYHLANTLDNVGIVATRSMQYYHKLNTIKNYIIGFLLITIIALIFIKN